MDFFEKIGEKIGKTIGSDVEFDGMDLNRTFSCKSQAASQEISVVLELEAINRKIEKKIPCRYALVIDISGSMNGRLNHTDTRTLLDRAKVFAEAFVKSISPDSFVTLVTFDHNAYLNLRLLSMKSEENKEKAIDVIHKIKTGGNTNISAGVFKALEVFGTTQTDGPTRDFIILFTDGEPNNGITEASKMVEEYRERNLSFGLEYAVPISALTIGDYKPTYLCEISRSLGSDGFYWVNSQVDFEADMLLPLTLSKMVQVTDIEIEFETKNGATIKDGSYGADFLMRFEAKTTLDYFIHNMPSAIKRHLSLVLQLPANSEEMDEEILSVNITYLDCFKKTVTIKDFVHLTKHTLQESYSTEDQKELGQENLKHLQEFISFRSRNSMSDWSWTVAVNSFKTIAVEDCRQVAKKYLRGLLEDDVHISNREEKLAARQKQFEEAMMEISKIEKEFIYVFGEHSAITRDFVIRIRQMTRLFILKSEVVSSYSIGRLMALESSLSKQMPVAEGVYQKNEKQLFATEEIQIQQTHRIKKVTQIREEKMMPKVKIEKPVQIHKPVKIEKPVKIDKRCEGVSKEKWIQYKSQIQVLNERFESSLSTLTSTAHIERSNLQLVELWENATEDCRRLQIEIENLRKNDVYREQLKIIKIELNKLYCENYEITRTNQELRMVNDELNIKVISFERRIQLLEAQMKERANIQKRLVDELKYELEQAKKTITILLADCQRYSEMTVELEAEIATYKSLLKKLNQKENEMGISCGGVTQSQIVTTTVMEQSTVSEQIIPQMIACDLGSGGGHRGRSSSLSSSDSD